MSKLSFLASVSQTRSVLEQHGLMTKKALGQHFLINDGIVQRICDLAELTQEDKVIEVGPGIGTLSVALLQRAGKLIAIERDTDLPQVLAQTCKPWQDSFTLISGDALEVAPEDLSFAPNKLVSNLPYAVAATIVLDYFERFQSIESQTIMVQAEVADRMCAKPGTKNYGAYTVKLGLWTAFAGRFSVSEGNFFPPPRVKSAVIRLDRKHDVLPDDLRRATMVMADVAFATRRKTIANSMKTYFSNPQSVTGTFDQNSSAAIMPEDIVPHIGDLLLQAGIPTNARGESLEQAQFVALGKAYLQLRETL